MSRFPVSDHCDGRRFFNPGQQGGRRRRLDLLRWRLGGHRARWPERIIDPPYPPPPDSVKPGSLALTYIGHASFLIRLPGLVVLTDPIFSERCSPLSWLGPRRARPPGIALDMLPRPDVVLISHNHYDHLDLPSLRDIARRHAPRFITTLGNAATLRRAGIAEAIELDWWQETSLGPVRITATPARHFSARSPFNRNRSLWAGFMVTGDMVTSGTGRLLFAGDSGAGPHWQMIRERLGAPDLALLPIGAYEPRWFMRAVHMNPEEAVAAHHALGARRSIGMHFGTFQLTDEPIDAPVRDLEAARGSARFGVLGFGETRILKGEGLCRSAGSEPLRALHLTAEPLNIIT
ncbi:MAG: MBL fold metallo-hydrolase [Acidisphaera sp.]|nr:MBL fold metallo-hydrolase [Acidisphaera sp.]